MPLPILTEFERDASLSAGQGFLELITAYYADTARGSGPVSSTLDQPTLAARFEEPLPQTGRPLAEVLARVAREILPDCNRLLHPMYLGHQVSAPLPAAVWSEALIGALNQSVAVAEMSPVGTAIEHRVIRWMADLAGFGAEAGGTLTSGGTEATFTALLAARSAAIPDVWERGVGPNPPVVIYGEQAHYAVTRAIGELGIGRQNALAIPAPRGKLDVAALTRALARLNEEGRQVMAVVATAGSTPTGAFDDLDAIGRVCEERWLWLHVDGAHGASALFSPSHRHRLAGLGRARSIAWDPHKVMGLPLSAGLLLVRRERDLEEAFAQRAPYLFHAAEGTRTWDQGVRSFACSRRADVFKLWIALQRYGAEGIGQLYDHLCATTHSLYDRLRAHPAFETLHEPEANILCFRYVGAGAHAAGQLDTLNRDLRERYNRSGRGWITATNLDGRRVLRVTVMNPRTRVEHLDALVAGLAEMGSDLSGER